MTRAQPSQANPLAGVTRAWPAIALPRNEPRHRIADLLRRIRAAVRAESTTDTPKTRPKREYHPPLRESFMEEAAMRREMFRL
ncbi:MULTISPECIES: hypothetical protein [Mycolicibacterium]|uniref:Uncharacterized protein n=1 Tax=Mycolicibacterium wolinskyi TaxID=59750 RepID=A0A1X2F2H9_9MYCO|nr:MULTISPECIES: hypothetical protein [Mycolicibacterium]MCV7287634.1 hypothetical protein [Mycolicibacterium wolinskyi]MCV7294532.1 hypothetical protein [Mycolicibacterium goodii]ORX12578.1 hypothetical protein AWC31_31975 [Mycolicibacterium wolinskyi]